MSLDLGPASLLVVSDGSGDRERILTLGWAAARGGAWGFQIREPRLGGRALAEVVARLRGSAARIIVADRVDVALAAGAFGVQLGERSLPLARVRALVGDKLRIGRSVHSPDMASAAAAGSADWLLFGHVFATPSKADLAPAGLAGLRTAVVAANGRPLLAIGGMNRVRVAEVLAQGACGVAVIRAVAEAEDPERAVREMVGALAAAAEGRGGARCVKSSP
jgi:thiamine-phosphate pyrophosphorylase